MGSSHIPFTPKNASINRVRILDLPGIPLEDEVKGKQAYNLLSTPAIVQHVLKHAGELHLPAKYLDGDINRIELRRDLPRYLDSCLDHPDNDVKKSAFIIAQQLGRYLGYILLTLHRGDPINRQARVDWTDAEWTQWHHIRTVYIGGGLVSGHLGAVIIEVAQGLIASAGYGESLAVMRSPFASMLTLFGACRYLPAETKVALCVDLGHTSVKSAVSIFHSGELIHMVGMPSVDVIWAWQNDPSAWKDIDPHQVIQFVSRTLIDSWRNAARTHQLDRDVILSIAAYVQGGKLLGNGIYARMDILTEDVSQLLENTLRENAGIHTKIHMIHDGTAAAATHAGKVFTAVLVLGTAIGVGFAPVSDEYLRPLSSDFVYHPHYST